MYWITSKELEWLLKQLAEYTGEKLGDLIDNLAPERYEQNLIDFYRKHEKYGVSPEIGVIIRAPEPGDHFVRIDSIYYLNPNFQRFDGQDAFERFFAEYENFMNSGLLRRPIFGDPLVLDLNGDGIKTIDLVRSNAFFDLDGDKFAEKTGWISKDDGILTIDRNSNNRIDNVNEIFGNNTMNGFEDLKQLDTNNDQIIDANDLQFKDLKLWQDVNENGITDEGELKSLTEAGIKEISLKYGSADIDSNGNFISQISTYTSLDGSQGIAGDVDLRVSQVITRYNGDFTLDTDVLFLPWLRGYGDVAALPISASQDSYCCFNISRVRGYQRVSMKDV